MTTGKRACVCAANKKRFFLIVFILLAMHGLFCQSPDQAAGLSFSQLTALLPQLNEPFPIEADADEFWPDGSLAATKRIRLDRELEEENSPLLLRALYTGYEDITEVFYDNDLNDWGITVNGKPYIWADGRIVPPEVVPQAHTYNPYFMYTYPREIFTVSPEYHDYYAQLFSGIMQRYEGNPNLLGNLFLRSEFYGNISKENITKQLEPVSILGSTIYVHKRVAGKLKTVNNKLLELKKQKKFKSFFKNYARSYGFNWRDIQYISRMSNHALGIAIDVMAKYYGDLNAYWYWEATVNEEWFMLTPEQRWMPPKEIVQIFEDEGFVWGGYWQLWDTMHFEYRPEYFALYEYLCVDVQRFYTEADIDALEAREIEAEKAAAEDDKETAETDAMPETP